MDFHIHIQSLKQGNDICSTIARLRKQSHGGLFPYQTKVSQFLINLNLVYLLLLSLSTSPILQKRLESLTEAELAQLIEQVEEEKRRLASEEQPK